MAFNNLHGKSAGKLVEIIPIEPALSLNRVDSRFVDAKEVLSGLGSETNLAAMDWQDFERLIRELFEKEFKDRGAEVKITQARRDRGVDAIVFVPDPIHGGKYVIQAKRYTNTLGVSAVRDLCAVVKKEGASRGILVTTSTYGADAYALRTTSRSSYLVGGTPRATEKSTAMNSGSTFKKPDARFDGCHPDNLSINGGHTKNTFQIP